MIIGLVTPYFPDAETINSGLANHFFTLAEALTNFGHEVVVIHIRSCYENETALLEKKTINDNITVLTYKVALSKPMLNLVKHKWALTDFLAKIKCMFIAAKNLPRITKTYKLDIIETTSYFSLTYFYTYTFEQIPVVTRVSTTFLQMMDSYYGFISRLLNLIGTMEIKLIKRSRFLITHAHDHANTLEKLFGMNATKFHIIPHGVNVPAEKELCHKDNFPLKILYVGRIEYRKGTDILLQAIPLVLRQTDDIVFQLIGLDKENAYEVKFRAENNSEISSKVTFSGQLNNIATYKAYAECDFFVAPSRYESFGLIYIEAMSYGKPVIGCEVGGVPEIIKDYRNGLFAEVDNAESLADKIILLAKDKKLRTIMGINARHTVINKFSKEMLAKSSIDYYKKVIISYS